jgi:hypothetical protein
MQRGLLAKSKGGRDGSENGALNSVSRLAACNLQKIRDILHLY